MLKRCKYVLRFPVLGFFSRGSFAPLPRRQRKIKASRQAAPSRRLILAAIATWFADDNDTLNCKIYGGSSEAPAR